MRENRDDWKFDKEKTGSYLVLKKQRIVRIRTSEGQDDNRYKQRGRTYEKTDRLM